MRRSILLFFLLLPVIVSAQGSADTMLRYTASVTGYAELDVPADTITAFLKIKANIYDKNYTGAMNALCDKVLADLKITKIATKTLNGDDSPPRLSRKYTIGFSSVEDYEKFKQAAEQYPSANTLELSSGLRDARIKPATINAANMKLYTLALEDAKAKMASISKVYGTQPGKVISVYEGEKPDEFNLSRPHTTNKISEEAQLQMMADAMEHYELMAQKSKYKYKRLYIYTVSTKVNVVYSLK